MDHPFPSDRLNDGDFGFEREIQSRAYELYEQRGKENGHELDDWLQAEAEVLQMRVKAIIHEILLGRTPTEVANKRTKLISTNSGDTTA